MVKQNILKNLLRALWLYIFVSIFFFYTLTSSVGALSKREAFQHPYYNPRECSENIAPAIGGALGSGSKVYVLGDSITARSAASYKLKFSAKGVTPVISAVSGRSWTSPGNPAVGSEGTQGTGQQAVATDTAEIKDASGIVIALGTNGYSGSNNVDEILTTFRSINSSAPIWWVNIANGPPSNNNVPSFNKLLTDQQAAGKIKVIDWAKVVDPSGNGTNNPQGILDDGTHPKIPDGVEKLTTLVVDQISGGSINSAISVVSGASGSVAPAGFDPDPAAVEMYEKDLKPRIEPLIPLYQKAAQAEGMADWEILPALHNLEYGLRRDNPTTNTGFRTPFQMNAQSLAKQGIDISKPAYTPGHELTDDEFVEVAQAAIRLWLMQDGKTLGVDLTKPVTPEQAAKVIVAYKSGAGSVWFNGRADFNLHAYAWAGYDTTPAHKLPMPWGPGSPFGDEVAGTTVNKPGAATLFALLKGGSFAVTAGGSCAKTEGGASSFSPISGSRAELIEKILASGNIKWGNSGNASTQKQDVQDCLSDNTLAAFVAMAEQSGVPILINSIARDHGGCSGGGGSDHNSGKALDIGYYGVGDPNHNENGDKLYKYLYDNRQALKVGQMIWKMPPDGYQCTNAGQPTDCYTFYGSGTMSQHYHHIHVSFQ